MLGFLYKKKDPSKYFIKNFVGNMKNGQYSTVRSYGVTVSSYDVTGEGITRHVTQTMTISFESAKEKEMKEAEKTKEVEKTEKTETKETKEKEPEKKTRKSPETTDENQKKMKCCSERDLFLGHSTLDEVQKEYFDSGISFRAPEINELLEQLTSKGLPTIYFNSEEHVIYEDGVKMDLETTTLMCYGTAKYTETYNMDRYGSSYTVSHISQPNIVRSLYWLKADGKKMESIVKADHKNLLKLQGAFIINGFVYAFTEPYKVSGIDTIKEKYLTNPYLKLKFIVELTEAFGFCSKIHQFGNVSKRYMTCTEDEIPCTLKLSHFGHSYNPEHKPKKDVYILGMIANDIISSDINIKGKEKEELKNFITQCTMVDPEKRPTFEECNKFFLGLEEFYSKDTTS